MAAPAGIGDLPDTIMDWAVVLRMQKRKPGEKVARFRSRFSVPELNALRDRLAAWLSPLRGTAGRMVPAMPVQDRAADAWEPLVITAGPGRRSLARARPCGDDPLRGRPGRTDQPEDATAARHPPHLRGTRRPRGPCPPWIWCPPWSRTPTPPERSMVPAG
ncbi:hypothetical protein GCM10018780_41660 [Streptomyces lanatus]|nr:hypothetical protein GCM10018780_41660 [Streptomyces lanatus]